MIILIVSEHSNGAISDATLSTITCAQQIGGDIHLLVMGSDCAEAANAAAQINGVGKVLKLDHETVAHDLAENTAAVVVSQADNYSHILSPAGTYGKNLMPRVAALLDVQQISEITKILSPNSFERPIYAGNAMMELESNERIHVITVRTTSFEACSPSGGSASIEDIQACADSGLSSFVKAEISSSERPELTSARIVVSGGRGMQSGENFSMLEKVADKLGAAVGASRAAVDAGYVPNEYQVGQTGKVVAPDLYIAVGISGAIQHLAGMKDSKVIVAINKDDEAPIFQVADFGLVADLFDAIPELEKELG